MVKGGMHIETQEKSENRLLRYNHLLSELDEQYRTFNVHMGLSDSVMNILYVLQESGGSCPQSVIAQKTSIPRQTINSALRRLEKDGITELRPGKGRATIVCLTEAGVHLAEEKITPIMEMEENILDSWTEEELEMYFALTRRYAEGLRTQIQAYFAPKEHQ